MSRERVERLPALGRRFRDPVPLGQGAGGAVWRARDRLLAEDVAVKLLAVGEQPREFRVLRQFDHPGIVRVLDVGLTVRGEPWFSMRLLTGQPFGGPGPGVIGAEGTARWAEQVAGLLDAVAALHDRGWVHGDLKPDNILLDPATDRPVLIDFGLALAAEDAERTLRGTLGWIAPEVLEGAEPDEASDLYALGVLAATAWGGAAPFPADALRPGLDSGDEPELAGEPPPPIARWIRGLLRRDPALRPSSAREALASLEAALDRELLPPEALAARLGPTRPIGREGLLVEIATELEQGAVVLLGGGSGAGRTALLQAVDDMLRQRGEPATRLHLDPTPGASHLVLRSFLHDRGRVLDPVPADRGDTAGRQEAWQVYRASLASALRSELEAEEGPLLVDDLEPRSLVGGLILEELAAAGRPALVAVAAELEPAVAAVGDVGRPIILRGLGPAEVESWLRVALGPVQRPADLAAWLVERTEGLPGALVTTMRSLLGARVLSLGERGWLWSDEPLRAWELDQGTSADVPIAGDEALARARAAADGGDLVLARHLLEQALERHTDFPELAEAAFRSGEYARILGAPAEAAARFRQSRQASSDPGQQARAAAREVESLMTAGEHEGALEVLAAAQELLGAASLEDRLLAHNAAGTALVRLGRFDEARAEAGHMAGWLAQPPEPENALRAAIVGINADLVQGRSADAAARAEAALGALPPTGYASIRGRLENALGHALLHSGELDRAARVLEQALQRLQSAGAVLNAARVANNLGIARYQQGRWSDALVAWEGFVELARRGGVGSDLLDALNNLGSLYRDSGQVDRARACLQDALDTALATGHESLAPMLLGNLAEVAAIAGDPVAADLYVEAAQRAEATRNRSEQAEALRRLAQLRLDQGDLSEFAVVAGDARIAASAASAGLELLLLDGLRAIASVRAGSDELPDGSETAQAVVDRLRGAGLAFEAARMELRLAEGLQARDRHEEAEARLDPLEAVFRPLGARPELARLESLRRRLGEVMRLQLDDIGRHYDALQDLTLRLSRERDVQKLLETMLDRALDLVGEERGYVLLLEDGVGTAVASRHVGQETLGEDLAPSSSVVRRVMETRKPLVVLDIDQEESLGKRASVMAAGLRSVICVPILRSEELLGLIYVDGKEAVGGAPERKASLLMACADAASVAIENARLIQALRDKTNAMAIMAHELRTPIGAIIGFASEMMTGGTTSPEEDQELLGLIKSEGERVSHMVNQVLERARMRDGAVEHLREFVDPVELVLASTDVLRPLARQAEIHMVRDADDDVPDLLGDRDRLIQVLVNLVSNAIKFSPSGGTVRVHAHAREDAVELVVEDEGPGIPPDRLDIIFDPYQQAGSEGMRRKGVGLGLAVSREIVLQHGGKITAGNRAEGGARFVVWLPSGEDETLLST